MNLFIVGSINIKNNLHGSFNYKTLTEIETNNYCAQFSRVQINL